MACTADKIVASPFAVLGSIGVISQSPNVYERLKKEGIAFNTITAGKVRNMYTYVVCVFLFVCVCFFFPPFFCVLMSKHPHYLKNANNRNQKPLITTRATLIHPNKQYKRTLTPFKEATAEDIQKSKEDVEQILVLFKDFVQNQRCVRVCVIMLLVHIE